MFSKKKAISLRGEIDTAVVPAEIRITPSTGDVWVDFGYWLEATNFMAFQAMKHQNWTKKQMQAYIAKYLNDALDDVSTSE